MNHITPTNHFTTKVNNNTLPNQRTILNKNQGSKIPISVYSQNNKIHPSNLLKKQIKQIDPKEQKKSFFRDSSLNRMSISTHSSSTKKTIAFAQKSKKTSNEFIAQTQQHLETQSSLNKVYGGGNSSDEHEGPAYVPHSEANWQPNREGSNPNFFDSYQNFENTDCFSPLLNDEENSFSFLSLQDTRLESAVNNCNLPLAKKNSSVSTNMDIHNLKYYLTEHPNTNYYKSKSSSNTLLKVYGGGNSSDKHEEPAYFPHSEANWQPNMTSQNFENTDCFSPLLNDEKNSFRFSSLPEDYDYNSWEDSNYKNRNIAYLSSIESTSSSTNDVFTDNPPTKKQQDTGTLSRSKKPSTIQLPSFEKNVAYSMVDFFDLNDFYLLKRDGKNTMPPNFKNTPFNTHSHLYPVNSDFQNYGCKSTDRYRKPFPFSISFMKKNNQKPFIPLKEKRSSSTYGNINSGIKPLNFKLKNNPEDSIDCNDTNEINSSKGLYTKLHFPSSKKNTNPSISKKVDHNSTTNPDSGVYEELDTNCRFDIKNPFLIPSKKNGWASFKGIVEREQNCIVINKFEAHEEIRNFSRCLFGKFSKGVNLEKNRFDMEFLAKATATNNYRVKVTQYGSFDPNMLLHQPTGDSALKKFSCIQYLNKESHFEYTIIPSMLNIGSRIFIYSKPSTGIIEPLVLDIRSKQANGIIVLGRMPSIDDNSPSLVIPCVSIDTMSQKLLFHELENEKKDNWVSIQKNSHGFKEIKKIKKSFGLNTIFFYWHGNLKFLGKEKYEIQINYGYCNKDSSDFAGISMVLQKNSIIFSCGKYSKDVFDSETTILNYTKNLECDLPSFEFNNQKKGLSICWNLKKKKLEINTLMENRKVEVDLGEEGVVIVE
jgi:hypothetical protein